MQAGDHNGPPPNGIRSSSFVPRRSRSRSVPSVNAGKNGEFGSVGALSGLSKPLSLVRQSYAEPPTAVPYFICSHPRPKDTTARMPRSASMWRPPRAIMPSIAARNRSARVGQVMCRRDESTAGPRSSPTATGHLLELAPLRRTGFGRALLVKTAIHCCSNRSSARPCPETARDWRMSDYVFLTLTEERHS
jgi:hypothetical protein